VNEVSLMTEMCCRETRDVASCSKALMSLLVNVDGIARSRQALLFPDLEFSRLESWSRDVLRPVFTSLGLGLGLGTLESRFRSWSWDLRP